MLFISTENVQMTTTSNSSTTTTLDTSTEEVESGLTMVTPTQDPHFIRPGQDAYNPIYHHGGCSHYSPGRETLFELIFDAPNLPDLHNRPFTDHVLCHLIKDNN